MEQTENKRKGIELEPIKEAGFCVGSSLCGSHLESEFADAGRVVDAGPRLPSYWEVANNHVGVCSAPRTSGFAILNSRARRDGRK